MVTNGDRDGGRGMSSAHEDDRHYHRGGKDKSAHLDGKWENKWSNHNRLLYFVELDLDSEHAEIELKAK